MSFTELFSSEKHDWETPQEVFGWLNEEFDFGLDAAASDHNAKCKRYLTQQDNSLAIDWSKIATSVWLNPPYGRGIDVWLEKAYKESLKGCVVVCLVFARPDTNWWHTWAQKAAEIRFVKGRLRFSRNGKSGPATAPSCVLVFDEARRMPVYKHVEVTYGKAK